MHTPECRFCAEPLTHVLCDLGMSPLANSYVSFENSQNAEKTYPLKVWVCSKCLLAQLESFESPDAIFSDYLYFSSFSTSWVEHAKRYCEMMTGRFGYNAGSQIIEIASNDGYLLQHFIAAGIPVLGIEPAANIARVAVAKGVPTLVGFFGEPLAKRLAAEGKRADLIACANVLAQVPDVNDFVRGVKKLLKPHGVVTVEFPHLMRLIEGNQFDTIYHEHFSYFSFLTVERIFAAHGITLFDVEELPTHGGSLRIFGAHAGIAAFPPGARIAELRARELAMGFTDLHRYSTFAEQVQETKRTLLDFLIQAKREGKVIVGYGAPGKGNTLLNYCGIRTDFLDYTVDRNPYKQGKFLPGTHIPIYPPDRIAETRPDYVLVLPWNFKDEIMAQLAYVRDWGARFVVPIPTVTVYA